MKKQRVASLGIIAGIFFLVVAYGWASDAAAQDTEKIQAKECHLKIEGMSCGMCAAKIKSGLKDLVISSNIDVEKGTGKFAYAEGKTSCKELSEKVTDIGFKAVAD